MSEASKNDEMLINTMVALFPFVIGGTIYLLAGSVYPPLSTEAKLGAFLFVTILTVPHVRWHATAEGLSSGRKKSGD